MPPGASSDIPAEPRSQSTKITCHQFWRPHQGPASLCATMVGRHRIGPKCKLSPNLTDEAVRRHLELPPHLSPPDSSLPLIGVRDEFLIKSIQREHPAGSETKIDVLQREVAIISAGEPCEVTAIQQGNAGCSKRNKCRHGEGGVARGETRTHRWHRPLGEERSSPNLHPAKWRHPPAGATLQGLAPSGQIIGSRAASS